MVNIIGSRMTIALFIITVLIAGNIFINGCGGGPGLGSVITGTMIEDDDTKTDPVAVVSKTIEISGTAVSTTSAPDFLFASRQAAIAPMRAVNFKDDYTISLENISGTAMSVNSASFTDQSSFVINAPLSSAAWQAVIVLKHKSGYAAYKAMIGKIPAAGNIAANAIKVSNVRISDETTAKALYFLENQSKIPDKYIALADTSSLTEFQSSADLAVNDSDGSKFINAVRSQQNIILKTFDMSSDSLKPVKTNFLSNLASLFNSFIELAKLYDTDAALRQVVGPASPASQIMGVTIGKNSSSADVGNIVNKINGVEPTPVKTLDSISISKTADAVASGSAYNLGLITATAAYSDSSSSAVTVSWSITSGGGSISGSVFTAPAGPATVVLTASYSENSATKTKTLTLTVSAPPQTSAVVISEQKVTKPSAGNYSVSWKTSPATSVKAKITVMSSSIPSAADKVLDEAITSESVSHEYTVKAADAPGEFYGLKISYLILDSAGEDIGTYKVVEKKDFLSEAPPVSQSVVISSAAVVKSSSGDYTVSWKTNAVTNLKAKITIMSSNIPNAADKTVNEQQSGTIDHSVTLSASIMPASFAGIRISYLIFDEAGEDIGTYKDIDKNSVQ